ncbi:MAG TPA: hypothetical protein VEA39_06160 [Methylophilaceae bacterium]|nr:hypothetical protein [Methylophilaceae bacterium]
MTPHTNQVVPVEPTEEMLSILNPHLNLTPIARYKALLAAAPQQQSEPVAWLYGYYPVFGNGEVVRYSATTSELEAKQTGHVDIKPLYTQPLTADASFNQGIDATIEALKGKIPAPYLRKLEVLKRPTDMVTIPKEVYDALLVWSGAEPSQSVLALAVDKWRSSSALEGK